MAASKNADVWKKILFQQQITWEALNAIMQFLLLPRKLTAKTKRFLYSYELPKICCWWQGSKGLPFGLVLDFPHFFVHAQTISLKF